MKELIIEINRYQELMGIKKILKEQKIFETFVDILSDFIMTTEKRLPNIIDEVEVGGMRVKTSILKDIKDVLENTSLYNALDDSSKIIMAKIASQSAEYVDLAYKSFFGEISKRLGLSETDIIRKAAQDHTDGISFQNIIKALTGDADPYTPALLSKKLYKKITDFEKNTFVEEIPKPPVKADDTLAAKLSNVKVKKATASPELSRLRKIMASNKTVFNSVRKNLNRCWVDFEEDLLKEERFIQSIYDDLARTGNKLTGDLTDKNSDLIETELRNTAQKIRRLLIKNESNKTPIESLYVEIEKTLNTIDDSLIRSKVPDIMKKLRESDPYREGTLFEKSWFWEFLNTTAFQKTINAVGRLIKNSILLKKQALQDLLELADRLLGWLISASFKTAGVFTKNGELAANFKNMPIGKASLLLARDLWLAQHIGIPVTVALFEVTINMFKLRFTREDGVIFPSFSDAVSGAFSDAFVSEYENNDGNVTFGSFLRNFFLLDQPGILQMWNWFDTTAQGKNRLTIPEDWKQMFRSRGYDADVVEEVVRSSSSIEEVDRRLRERYPDNGGETTAPEPTPKENNQSKLKSD